ncbi:MAG: type II toxin-antitoxin system MqsA family antitoxin [Terracidiphilus sp.]
MYRLTIQKSRGNSRFCFSLRRGTAELRPLVPLCDSGGLTFSHNENGRTKPPLALVKLVKVLGCHPNLLDEIKVA